MNIQKLPFYNLIFALLITVLMVVGLVISAHGAAEPNTILPAFFAILFFVLLFNPAFWLWLVGSLALWVASHFVKTEKGANMLAWSVVLLPFVSFGLFRLLVMIRS